MKATLPESPNQLIERFEDVLEPHLTRKATENSDKLCKNFEKIGKTNFSSYDDNAMRRFVSGRLKAQQTLADVFIRNSLIKKFPLVNEDLFALKRFVVIERSKSEGTIVCDTTSQKVADKALETKPEPEPITDKKNAAVRRRRKSQAKTLTLLECPLFAVVPAGDETADIGTYKKTSRTSWGGTRSTTVHVTSKVPLSDGPELRKAKNEALSKLYEALAEMMRDPIFGDIVSLRSEEVQPQFKVAWIPSTSSLSVNVDTKVFPPPRSADPALLLEVLGSKFLIATWDIKDEEPFEHLLREFTEGDASKALKKVKNGH